MELSFAPGQDCVEEEIRRFVAHASAARAVVSTAELVAKVMRACPGSNLSEREIADRILVAAAAAGVPVEIGAMIDSARE